MKIWLLYCFEILLINDSFLFLILGKQEAVEATLAALEAVVEPLKSMTQMLVDICAYAGMCFFFFCFFFIITFSSLHSFTLMFSISQQ